MRNAIRMKTWVKPMGSSASAGPEPTNSNLSVKYYTRHSNNLLNTNIWQALQALLYCLIAVSLTEEVCSPMLSNDATDYALLCCTQLETIILLYSISLRNVCYMLCWPYRRFRRFAPNSCNYYFTASAVLAVQSLDSLLSRWVVSIVGRFAAFV